MQTTLAHATAISDVLNRYYFPGIYEGNLKLLQEIYHPGAMLFGDVKGKPYFKTLTEYFEAVENRQSPKMSGKPFEHQILNIKQIRSIGIAELQVRMYDFNYHEFLSFHQLDGRWLIVNKMISDLNI